MYVKQILRDHRNARNCRYPRDRYTRDTYGEAAYASRSSRERPSPAVIVSVSQRQAFAMHDWAAVRKTRLRTGVLLVA